MSPIKCIRAFTAVAVFLLLLSPAFSQRGGSSAPPATGGNPGGGNPSPGGTNPGTGRNPSPTPNPNPNQNGQYPGRQNPPIFLSGRVMLDDGTPPPRSVAIERVCNGTNRRIEGHTDSKGYFSIQLGDRSSDVLQDASTGGFDGFGGLGGAANNSLGGPGGGGISEQQLMNCELRADLPGYQSQAFSLAMRKSMDDPNIGTILLHRIGASEGSTVSATTLGAPKNAKKALEKGMELAHKNKFDEAQTNLKKAVELYPRYAEAWCELGRVQAAQKNLDEARKSFDQSIAADPKYVPPYIQISMLEIAAQRWQELADVTDKAVKLDSFNYPQAFFFNAVAQYNLHNVQAAEQSARRAEKLDTRHQIPQVSHLLGVILAGRREYATAATEFRDYLKFAPGAKDADAVRSQLEDMEKLAALPDEPPK